MSIIAILMATYNGEKYIAEMLESLLSQTYQDFVCYIHDDESTDKTMNVITQYVKKYPEKFVVVEGPKQGSSKRNFMWMLNCVEADYYMFADQDDVWLEDKIEKTKCRLDESGKNCVFTDAIVVDEYLNTISNSLLQTLHRNIANCNYTELLVDNVAAGCTMLFSKKIRELAIKLKDLDLIEMHDHWIVSVASVHNELAYLNEGTILYRQHSNNQMGAKTDHIAIKLLRTIKGFFAGEIVEEKRAFNKKAINLARALIIFDDIEQDKKETLRAFTQVLSKNKFARIHFYKVNHITRNSKLSTWWMWLWV